MPAYPVAVRRTIHRSFHDHVFEDHFEWLRDKDSDDVRAHLPSCALLVVKDGDVGATAFSGDDEPVFVPAPRVDVVAGPGTS